MCSRLHSASKVEAAFPCCWLHISGCLPAQICGAAERKLPGEMAGTPFALPSMGSSEKPDDDDSGNDEMEVLDKRALKARSAAAAAPKKPSARAAAVSSGHGSGRGRGRGRAARGRASGAGQRGGPAGGRGRGRARKQSEEREVAVAARPREGPGKANPAPDTATAVEQPQATESVPPFVTPQSDPSGALPAVSGGAGGSGSSSPTSPPRSGRPGGGASVAQPHRPPESRRTREAASPKKKFFALDEAQPKPQRKRRRRVQKTRKGDSLPLHQAVEDDEPAEAVEAQLLRSEGDMRKQNTQGDMPLHVALKRGSPAVVVSILATKHPPAVLEPVREVVPALQYALEHEVADDTILALLDACPDAARQSADVRRAACAVLLPCLTHRLLRV